MRAAGFCFSQGSPLAPSRERGQRVSYVDGGGRECSQEQGSETRLILSRKVKKRKQHCSKAAQRAVRSSCLYDKTIRKETRDPHSCTYTPESLCIAARRIANDEVWLYSVPFSTNETESCRWITQGWWTKTLKSLNIFSQYSVWNIASSTGAAPLTHHWACVVSSSPR